MYFLHRLVGTPTERMWPEMQKLQGYKVSFPCNIGYSALHSELIYVL